jgi:hypothetical protein
MTVFVPDESNHGGSVDENARRFGNKMFNDLWIWPDGAKVDISFHVLGMNSGELILKINSDIIVSSVKPEMLAYCESLRSFENFADMGFWAACDEDRNRESVHSKGRNEQAKNILLDFVILAFIKAIDNNYRPEQERRELGEGLDHHGLELSCQTAADDEFIALHGLLERQGEFRYGEGELVGEGSDEPVPRSPFVMSAFEEEGGPQDVQ